MVGGFIEADVFTNEIALHHEASAWAKDLKQSPGDFEVKRQVKEVLGALLSLQG
jgi:hypothetical protein